MNPERLERWRTLTELLESVVTEVGPMIDTASNNLIAEFVANTEFEVAYEWISSLVSERDLRLTEEAKRKLTAVREILTSSEHGDR